MGAPPRALAGLFEKLGGEPVEGRERVERDVQDFAILSKIQRCGPEQPGGVEFFLVDSEAFAFRIDAGLGLERQDAALRGLPEEVHLGGGGVVFPVVEPARAGEAD